MAEVELENMEELEYGEEVKPIIKHTTCCVNARMEPSLDGEINCALNQGTELHIEKEENGWSKHELGWTMSEYLE